jgi:hypothetical protein
MMDSCAVLAGLTDLSFISTFLSAGGGGDDDLPLSKWV